MWFKLEVGLGSELAGVCPGVYANDHMTICRHTPAGSLQTISDICILCLVLALFKLIMAICQRNLRVPDFQSISQLQDWNPVLALS